MRDAFIQKFSKAAHANGITNIEFYTKAVKSQSVGVYQGSVEEVEMSDITSCYIQGEYNGKTGAISVEDFSDEFIEEGIRYLQEAASISKSVVKWTERMSCDNRKEYEFTPIEKMSKKTVDVEEVVTKAYVGLQKFNGIHCGEKIREITIQNDAGLCMRDNVKSASLWTQAASEKDGIVQTADKGYHAINVDDMDFYKLYLVAAMDACGMMDASPVPTGNYPIILKNDVLCEMLSMFIKAFGADEIRRKMSKLVGKVGEQIASDIVNIIEDPNLPEGINNRTFDDEGTPTQAKQIIKDGKLQMYLYNCYEAEKAGGVALTGNGFKNYYKETVGISVTNLKLVGQDKTRDDLLEEMGDGLYIRHCDGMFAGADVLTGDFTLISRGYLVKNGKKDRGVNQITIAGNFFDMLKDIVAIGNDYMVNYTENGVYIAPSIYIKNLVVSGL